MWTTRRAYRWASSGLCVTTISVWPGRVEVEQQRADLVAGGGVDRAGRLVGEQQRRLVDQRPGDRHPLPLAAGQPGRVGVAPVRDPQRAEQFVGALPRVARLDPGELCGQQHVVDDRHVVEQVEELEDHADLPAAEPCRARLATACRPVRRRPGPRPLVGRSIPAMRLSSVDLPTPDGPMMATASPGVDPQR